MAFEYIVDRESKFGTIVFDNINLHELPQPRQNDRKGRVDEVGIVNKHRFVKIQRTATIVYRLRTWLDENGYAPDRFGSDVRIWTTIMKDVKKLKKIPAYIHYLPIDKEPLYTQYAKAVEELLKEENRYVS